MVAIMRLTPALLAVPAAVVLLTVSACGVTGTETSAAAEPTIPKTPSAIIGIDTSEVVDNECLLTAMEIGALAGAAVGEGTNVETALTDRARLCEYTRAGGTQRVVASIDIGRLEKGWDFDDLMNMFRTPKSREIPGIARAMLVWESDTASNAGIYTDTFAVSVRINRANLSASATAPTDTQWKEAAQQVVTRLPQGG